MATASVAPARFPVGNRRILSSRGVEESTSSSSSSMYVGDGGDHGRLMSVELEGAMLSDTVFRFLDGSPESSVSSSGNSSNVEEDLSIIEEDKEKEDEESPEEDDDDEKKRSVFWEKHIKLFKETMSKMSVRERAIKSATKEVMKEIQIATREDYYTICKCSTTQSIKTRTCKNCLMHEICHKLQSKGYIDCSVWKTNWKSTHEIPSGEHKFIIVRNNNHDDHIIIEVRFRGEFEMAKTSGEGEFNYYDSLMERVPAVFVGRVERMKAVVKILCSAMKRCCKEKKLHLGPWRKYKYMQAKWFSTSSSRDIDSGSDEQPVLLVSSKVKSSSTNNSKTSMLTAAFTSLQPKAVAVL